MSIVIYGMCKSGTTLISEILHRRGTTMSEAIGDNWTP
jgi:hypothetical protein